MAFNIRPLTVVFLICFTFASCSVRAEESSSEGPKPKEDSEEVKAATATSSEEDSVTKVTKEANKTEERREESHENSSSEEESSEESDEKTCAITLKVPVHALSGCKRVKPLEENIERIKHDFSKRLETLENRVKNVLSDEADRNTFQHLEDKVYDLQVQLDKALDLSKHGSRHPGINRVLHNLRRERNARQLLEKRLQELEKRNQDIDCRLMGRPGVYSIRPFRGPGKLKVYCDNTWTVIQKRYNGSVDFFQDWNSYRKGFGQLDGEFWLGNDNIHYLTTQNKYKLRIEMTDWYGRQYFAEYSHFWIESVNNKYRLHLQGFTGNLVDSLIREDSSYNHNGMDFSTHDQNNGKNPNVNCALKYQGAWWYNDCYASNLNGRYCKPDASSVLTCMVWYGMLEKHVLEKVTMKIKENV